MISLLCSSGLSGMREGEPDVTRATDGLPYTTVVYGNGPGWTSGPRVNLTEVDTRNRLHVFLMNVTYHHHHRYHHYHHHHHHRRYHHYHHHHHRRHYQQHHHHYHHHHRHRHYQHYHHHHHHHHHHHNHKLQIFNLK